MRMLTSSLGADSTAHCFRGRDWGRPRPRHRSVTHFRTFTGGIAELDKSLTGVCLLSGILESEVGTMTEAKQHPDHDRLVAELRFWYTRSVPEMGYEVKKRRFGFYQRHQDSGRTRATVRDLPSDEVPEFLEDLHRYSGGSEMRFYIDDPELDRRVGPALIRAGCSPEMAEVFLAHVGAVPEIVSEPEGLTVEAVNDESIEEAVRTSIRGFESSEDPPDRQELEYRLALRRAEMAGQGRFLLARLRGEAAAVLGFYEGEDRFIFNLSTRAPFRRMGIASRLLLEVLSGAKERGCRSTIINADERGRPVNLYRSLGFTDELYWRRKYELGSPSSLQGDRQTASP